MGFFYYLFCEMRLLAGISNSIIKTVLNFHKLAEIDDSAQY